MNKIHEKILNGKISYLNRKFYRFYSEIYRIFYIQLRHIINNTLILTLRIETLICSSGYRN